MIVALQDLKDLKLLTIYKVVKFVFIATDNIMQRSINANNPFVLSIIQMLYNSL